MDRLSPQYQQQRGVNRLAQAPSLQEEKKLPLFDRFLKKSTGILTKIFPGGKVGKKLGGGKVSGKELAADIGEIGLTAAFGVKPGASAIKRIAFGSAIGAGAGAARELKKDSPAEQIARETGKGALFGGAIGVGFEGIGLGLRALVNKTKLGAFIQKRAGNAFNRALQTPTKDLTKQIEFNLETTGQKIAKAGFKGGFQKMKQQAQKKLAESGTALNKLLAKFPKVIIKRPQVVGNLTDQLEDTFGALTKNEINTIKKEVTKIPEKMNLTRLLRYRRVLDKKIDPTFWIEPNERKAFVGWVRYLLRGNMKLVIENSTDDLVVRRLNQEMGLAMDVRHLSALQEALRARGGRNIIPLGRFSFISELLDRTIFNPAITTRMSQRFLNLGAKTGQTKTRQAVRLGFIEGLQKKEQTE